MELQVNGMILKNNFLLVTNDRPIKSSNRGIYLFEDGSKADLDQGKILIDTKEGTPQALTLHILTPGKHTISTGIKNENPQTKSWASKTLNIDYKGEVVVTPSKDEKITVEENESCFASLESGTITITPTNHTTVTIDTISPTISNITGGANTPLKITAPLNAVITNKSRKLSFVQADTINLIGGNLNGTVVNTVTGHIRSSTAINLLKVNILTLEADSSCELKIGSANVIEIKSDSRVDLTVIDQIGELNINSTSFVNIIGGNYQNITISKSGGALNITRFKNIGSLTITAESFVEITGEVIQKLDIKKANGRVTINVNRCESITSNSASSATINGKHLNNIDIHANGRVDIETEESSIIKVNCSSALDIKGKKIEYINVTHASRVDINVDTLKEISVKSNSAVNVECKSGEQAVTVETSSRVDLKLATAKKVTVTTSSAVSVSAYVYLSDPVIKTSSRKSVEKRR